MPDLTITNARALSETKVRIDFSEPAVISAGLSDPDSYIFTVVSPGSIDVVPLSVDLPPGQPNPLFVEINITEHTNGAIYGVQLAPAAFFAFDSGNPSGGPVENYAGLGSSPNVDLVLGTAKNEAVVQFSEPLLDNAAARDVTNYIWDNGLSTLSVKDVSQNFVILETSDQTPDLLYQLTVRGIFSVIISDRVVVTDQIADQPAEGLTEDGVFLTEDGVFLTEGP